MQTIIPALIQYVLPVLVTALIPLIGVAIRALAMKWAAEGKESKGKALAARLLLFTDAVVADLNANLKDQLVAASADGTIDDAERAALKAAAMERIKILLADKGMAEVKEVFNIMAPALDTLLSGLIEKAVAGAKPSP